MAEYQDTKVTVLRKGGPRAAPRKAHDLAAAKRAGHVSTEAKQHGGPNHSSGVGAGAHKIDDPDYVPPKPSIDFRRELSKARQAKKMTQADLAKRLNIKAVDIAGFESGKTVPDGQIFSKLQRILGKLPKPAKKKKMPKE